MRKTAKAARVVCRKHGGDDLYSWAVFVDGVLRWNGMSRSEASWRASLERAKLRPN